MLNPDRRRKPRYQLRLQGRLIVFAEHHTLVTVDISECGVGLEAKLSLAPETRVAVEVGDADKERFTFRGAVAWCVQDQASIAPNYRMGITADTIGSLSYTAITTEEKSEILERILEIYAPLVSAAR
jgi:hypothetical protein